MNVELIDKMGSDLSVVNAARVSFAKKKELLDEKDEKLIKYLAEHNHWSPFGHTSLQFLIKAPIFVARQLVKHQVGLVWNEVSRRYVDNKPELYDAKVWRGRPRNSKQGSDGEIELDKTMKHMMTTTMKSCLVLYNALLQKGVAPEMARMVLPQNMMTEWYWTGSLMAFARVVNLRIKKDTQEETRVIATHIKKHLEKHFPISAEALLK